MRPSRLILPWAILAAILVTVAGITLFRLGLIERQDLALWPTFRLLHLDILHGRVPFPMLALFLAVQVVIWTAALYAIMVAVRTVRQRLRSAAG